MKGQKLGNVTSFMFLGADASNDDSKPEILSRIAQATAALTAESKLKRYQHMSLIKGKADALSCHLHISECL